MLPVIPLVATITSRGPGSQGWRFNYYQSLENEFFGEAALLIKLMRVWVSFNHHVRLGGSGSVWLLQSALGFTMGHSHWPQVTYSELISVLIGAMVFTVCYNVLAHHCPIAALCCCELNTILRFVLVIGLLLEDSLLELSQGLTPTCSAV